MMLSLIVALDRKGLIGRAGSLPWHAPADLKHFKALTMGKPLIMGRKTCLSLGRPLPGRRNLVLSRNPSFNVEGFEVFGDPAGLLTALAGAGEVMVIGGAEIYHLFIPLVQRAYVTLVDGDFTGDAFFPMWPLGPTWRLVQQADQPADERNPPLSLRCYEKVEIF